MLVQRLKLNYAANVAQTTNNPKKGNVIMLVGTITVKRIRIATLGTKVKVEI